MKVLSLFNYLFKRFPFYLTGIVVLLVVSSLLEGLTIFSLAPIVDYLIDPDLKAASPFTNKIAIGMQSAGVPFTLGNLLAVMFVLSLLTSVFSIITANIIIRTKYVVMSDLILGSFKSFFSARWQFFSSSSQGMLLNTFTREMNAVGDAFLSVALFFTCIMRLLFYLIIPFYISWEVTTISLAIACVLASPFLILGRVSYKLGQTNTLTANQISSVLQESLSSAKLILGFGNQHKSLEKLKHVFDTHIRATVTFQTLNQSITQACRPLVVVVIATALLAGSWYKIPFSELTVILFSLFQTIPLFGDLAAKRTSLDNLLPSFEQIISLQQKAKQLEQRSGTIVFSGFEHGLALDQVSFAYPDCQQTLMNISLKIPKGKMVAIVGESGTGKSTLIDLIMGFSEPGNGRIMIDGTPLQQFDIISYRQRIGYVPQDSILFNMSIRDNLLWANENATDPDIKHACLQANAAEFIEKLPQGYDTVVGDRGVRLSGGQIQRVALARAILRKPDLLILDEATSSLDSLSERLIQEAIEAIASETTVIVIAHRLSTIIRADHIIVLQNGRIVEQGTYQDLVKKNEKFNQMVKLQMLELSK